MPAIRFEDVEYDLTDGETVLEGLERHGVALASSCRAGVCQSCLVRATGGPIPPAAQKGLRETQRARKHLLACLCKPTDTLFLKRLETQERHQGVVDSIDQLSVRIARLRMRAKTSFSYAPGQFINLAHPSGHIRSYSLASVPELDATLELHVGLLPGGCVSGWIHSELRPGDTIEFMGPLGNCFYAPGKPDQPLFLLGTGTGLAPLYGIARDALARGHTAPVHLFHGALHGEGLYLNQALQELAVRFSNFVYQPCVLHPPAPAGAACGDISALAREKLPALKGWRVFLCGHPDLVRPLQRSCFLAGASMGDILADAFLPAAPAAAQPTG